MAHNPNEPGRRMPDDLPPTQPILQDERKAGGLWFPLLLLFVLAVGAAYYFFGDFRAPGPNVRADSGGAVTKSEPSPN